MNFDYEQARFWFNVLNALLTVAVGIYTYFATRDKDISKRFEMLADKTSAAILTLEDKLEPLLSQHNSRLDRIESDMKHMPNHQEISELKGDMKAVKVFQESIELQLETMRKGVNRIEDFLLRDKA